MDPTSQDPVLPGGTVAEEPTLRQVLLAKKKEKDALTREKRLSAILKANAAKRLKMSQREIVMKKVEQNMPITAEEQQLVHWTANAKRKRNQQLAIDAVSKLVIRPQNIDALRLVVEQTAARHGYNPIESLIMLTQSDNVEDKDKVSIHKALLPFLAPQLPAVKEAKREEDDGARVKVTVTHFVFPSHRDKPDTPIHETKPPMIGQGEQQEPIVLP